MDPKDNQVSFVLLSSPVEGALCEGSQIVVLLCVQHTPAAGLLSYCVKPYINVMGIDKAAVKRSSNILLKYVCHVHIILRSI